MIIFCTTLVVSISEINDFEERKEEIILNIVRTSNELLPRRALLMAHGALGSDGLYSYNNSIFDNSIDLGDEVSMGVLEEIYSELDRLAILKLRLAKLNRNLEKLENRREQKT